MSETNIKVGSVVLLKSDDDKSSKMIVRSINNHGHAALSWRDKDGKPCELLHIPLDGLKLAE